MVLLNGRLWKLVKAQHEEIIRLRAQAAQHELEHARNVRDLVEQFWITQEAGIDVREPVLQGLEDLRDQVARLEEHSG